LFYAILSVRYHVADSLKSARSTAIVWVVDERYRCLVLYGLAYSSGVVVPYHNILEMDMTIKELV